MSRSARNALASNEAKGGKKGLPPSHPAEQNPEHRQFLMRSLERNDVDLAALMDLNRSLHSVKDAVISTCGDLTLLDLGEGKIRLSSASSEGNDEERLEGDNLPEEGQDLCIDFLLRMKLRRKLLNRLIRRLHRISHAADGDDISPPGPPRYGDLRLHIDPEAVKQFEEHWKRQDQALKLMGLEREKTLNLRSEKDKWTAADQAEHSRKYVSDEEAEPGTPTQTEDPNKQSAKPAEATEGGAVSEAKAEAAQTGDGADTQKDPEVPMSSSETPKEPPPPLIDYEALKSYDEVYEKRVDEASGTVTYSILDEPVEEDYVKIKFGAGIGATHRSMSAKEKEAEFKRWQSSLLAKIPEQPTFEDLGMDDRVFLLNERRNQALKEKEELQKEQEARKKADEKAKSAEVEAGATDERNATEDDKNSADDPEESDKMDIDDASNSEKEGAGSNEAGKGEDEEQEESPSKGRSDVQAREDSGTEDEGEKPSENKTDSKTPTKDEDAGEDEGQGPSKRMKPISLAAVPTFYEQDLWRTKRVHAELMAGSLQDHARRRLEEVTTSYNAALHVSNERNTLRERLEQKIQHVRYERHRLSEHKNRYIAERSEWIKRYRKFNEEKLNSMLPSRTGKNPTGSQKTQEYRARGNQIAAEVGGALADVIDVVDMIGRGATHNPRFTLPRPSHAALVEIEKLRRKEAAYHHDLNNVTSQLRQCEEDRQRAWRKLLKVKADYDLPHRNYSKYGAAQGRIAVNMSNYNLIPLPNLRQSTQERVPLEVAPARTNLPSYVPVRSPVQSRRPASESRYSAARVRERISADGTVAPVSEPKKSKDGLYMRPAGRTRKGMEWDAVRGIWVPQRGGN